MNRIYLCLLTAVAGSGTIAPAFARYAAPPDWVSEASSRPTPANAGGASYVVLLDDTVRELDPRGISTEIRRMAIRVLTPPGRSAARMFAYYLQGSDRVTTHNGWLLRNGKEVSAPDFVDWVDGSSDPYGSLYSDFRYKSYDRSGDCTVGDIFAAETRVIGPMLAADGEYSWGWAGVPVVEEAFHLKVPAGFSVKAVVRGATPPSAAKSTDNREFSWVVVNTPFHVTEPWAPSKNPLDPYLQFTVEPPPSATQFQPKVLHTWGDVSSWLHTLNSSQCDTSLPLSETTQRLVKGCPTQLAKIRALGAYVQSLRYVAYDAGLAKGLGYQARKASLVFGKGYGDCKDKANLLCAMLHEAGIQGYVAAARSGDDREIWTDFPSASQFDHAIAAIRVDDETTAATVVKTEKWGRLLFFDPTNEHTRVGDLPWYLQGSLVFVQSAGSDALIKLPEISSSEGHAFVRTAILHLNPDGSCSGQASIMGRGQAGAQLRQHLFGSSTDESLRKFASIQLNENAQTAKLSNLVRHEESDSDLSGIAFDFSKSNYAQFLKNSMVVVKGEILERGPIPAFPATERIAPVRLNPVAYDDAIELVLPESMQPEEMPKAVSLTSPYGNYQREFKVDGKSIKLTRKLELKQMLVPVSEYPALRKFLSDLSKADRASMLLRTST